MTARPVRIALAGAVGVAEAGLLVRGHERPVALTGGWWTSSCGGWALTPLFADLDGALLEAGYANLWVVKGNTLTTPALDGRLLGGTVRARVLAVPPAGLEAREAPIPLETLGAGDEILLTSSIRGVHPAALPGREARFEVGAVVRASLEQEPAAVGAP